VNRSMEENILLDISLLDFDGYKAVEFSSMDGYDIKQENTFDKEDVKMHLNPLPEFDGKVTTAELKPLSFNVIRFKKA
ncbi:MAG: alpha-N-arabinofuranosidase, partial [Clostridia bacterium]|nr:alpha-N-arabinofuranosidase [Clostridia bacterium]